VRGAVAELLVYRHLLVMLAWRDIRVRYKQSVIGILWAVLMPVLIVTAGVLVRYAFTFAPGRSVTSADVASIAVKALPWAFFLASVRAATVSLTNNRALITKVYCPREVFPLAAVLACLLDFVVGVPVLAVLLVLTGTGVSVHALWVPLLLALLVLLVTATGLLLSCANVFLRDVRYLVEVILTFGIFFTPVFYSADMLAPWTPLLLLNPLAPLLEGLRDALVLHVPPDPLWVAYSGLVALAGSAAAWWVFDRAEPLFAERI
jgi:lipopolysaccharide transport system permease protein